IETGYTSTNGFKEMLKKIDRIEESLESLKPILSREDVLTAISEVSKIKVEDSIYDYIVAIVEETRKHPAVKLGGSPRAGIAILRLSKAWAYMHGRSYIIPDDVKAVAVGALIHRIILKPEYEIEGISPTSVVNDVLKKVPVPKP
ncbi:MAG: MoxR family ATPase, partial [Ignisphaera sp.]